MCDFLIMKNVEGSSWCGIRVVIQFLFKPKKSYEPLIKVFKFYQGIETTNHVFLIELYH